MYYKKIYQHLIVLCLTLGVLLLMGCQGKVLYDQTEGNIADVTLRAKDARHMSDHSGRPEPALLVNKGLYVDTTPISLARQPSWLRNHIVIRGDELPFSYYARTIAGGGGGQILTRYQEGVDQSAKISINYSGTVKGALDLLASKTGYIYSIHSKSIDWQAFVTKTFDIAFMPGTSDYVMGKAQGGGGAVSSARTGQNAVNAIIDDSAASQFSSLKGTLSIWKDLETGVKQLLSPEGRVVVSEATTCVTVRDRPTNVNLVAQFIGNLNKNLSKQVLVKIQILEVTLSNQYTYGINWNVVQEAFGAAHGNYVLNANFGTPISITPFGGHGIPAVGVQKDPASIQGITALINALTQQGKVSVVSEPRVVCQNNQVGSIRIVSQEGYLASIENSTVSGTGGVSANTITSQITPGTLITGLTLYILPKIMGNKIFLQVNADLSTNLGFKKISSTGQEKIAPTSTSQAIQLPNVTQKQFNQRSLIGSGDTLILSGFRQVSNHANAMQLFDSTTLGGRGAIQNNSETIVLITPIILHGCA